MKKIIQFHISKDTESGFYVAEGVDLPVVTQGKNLDDLAKNLKEAVELHLEGEDLNELGLDSNFSVLANFEIQPKVNA